MGTHIHKAICVTGWKSAEVESAHANALLIFNGTCCAVTEITEEKCNGFRSFFVAPDSYKIGREEHIIAEQARAQFIEKLQELVRKPYTFASLEWCEVVIHDEMTSMAYVERCKQNGTV